MNSQNKVIIIGAGFCGIVTTLNLVKRAIIQDIDITFKYLKLTQANATNKEML